MRSVLIAIALLFASPSFAQTIPTPTPPSAPACTGTCIKLASWLNAHIMVDLQVTGFNLDNGKSLGIVAPGVLYEFDMKGFGGPVVGGNLVTTPGQHIGGAITAGVSLHLPVLAGTPITHILIAYSLSTVSSVRQTLLVGPAYEF